MDSRRPLTPRGVQKLTGRERSTGLDPEDEAARWLREHDPAPPAPTPKAASKSKELHRRRQRQQRGGRC
jgi:hypothetical protein